MHFLDNDLHFLDNHLCGTPAEPRSATDCECPIYPERDNASRHDCAALIVSQARLGSNTTDDGDGRHAHGFAALNLFLNAT